MAPSKRSPLDVALALALGLLLVAGTADAQRPLPADSLARARTWSFWFMAGAVDSLTARMIPDVLQQMGGRDGLVQGMAMVAERAGIEKRVLEERFVWRNGRRQYWREMETTSMAEPFVLRFVMDEEGRIAGIGMGPKSAAPPVDSGGVAIKP